MYILFIYIRLLNSEIASIDHIEFESKIKCEKAKEELQKEDLAFNKILLCLEK